MAEVVLEAVGKTYPGGVEAVKGVDLVIADEEFVVLVGPSGCGKSTTLRMVAGLEDVTRGTISIDGRVVNEVPAKDRDIAMVFQNYALYPHMSVRQNLAFGLHPRRLFPSRIRSIFPGPYRDARRNEMADIARRIAEAAQVLGITEYLDRRPRELSGGQRQRVALGRAIVRDPKAFLFDEPLSNLDAKLRVEMRTELKALQRRLAATSIYVTHDQEEAMTLGDRLVVMKDGVVQQVGSPTEVYGAPANRFVASFVGTPPMNFLEGHLASEADELIFAAEGVRASVPPERREGLTGDRAVVLGVRPDALTPASREESALVARLEVIEHLGDRIDLFLEGPGGAALTARIAPQELPPAGSALPLSFDVTRAHFFAADGDGERLA